MARPGGISALVSRRKHGPPLCSDQIKSLNRRMDIDSSSSDAGSDAEGIARGRDGGGEAGHPSSAMAGGAASRFRLMHRVRFVDWNPSSITAIALTPSTYDPHTHYTYSPSLHHSGGSGREVLAVGRQNGNIEIYVWLGDQDQGSLQAATSSSRSRNQKADDAQDGATGSSAATAPGADAPAGSTNNKAAKHKRKRPRRKPANASPGTQGWVLERVSEQGKVVYHVSDLWHDVKCYLSSRPKDLVSWANHFFRLSFAFRRSPHRTLRGSSTSYSPTRPSSRPTI